MINQHSKRFDELTNELDQIEAAKGRANSELGPYTTIDDEKFQEWRIKAKSLISRACNIGSEHYKEFSKLEADHSPFDVPYEVLRRLRPVFNAAKSDFQGGYLTSIRNLIQSELFDSELEQSIELLKQGYKGPAAVVAGIVLETALRELCTDRSISVGKLDQMNIALAKSGCYAMLQQKRITAIADIRNSAAHGKWENFSDQDVADMIRDVQRFLTEHLS